MSAAAPHSYHGEFTLPASTATVFAYLTEPALLTEWWPNGAETDPVEGGAYHLWWDGPDGHLRGSYVTFEPPVRLEFTWAWDHEDLPPRRVDVRLHIRDAGSTTVVIEHDAGSAEELAGYREGWEFFIPQLRDALALAQ